MATAAGPAARITPPLSRPGIWRGLSSGPRRSICRSRRAPRTATRYRSTIFRASVSSTTTCGRCLCAPRRCARSVPTQTYLRSNPSWTSLQMLPGSTPAEGRGHGIGFAKYKNLGAYCAVVAEVEVDNEVRVKRLVLAVDVGLVINPDGVINQIEGGAIQSTSWTLKEQVKLDARGITSLGWEEYPVLKFSEVPAVEVELIDRPELPSVGAGEAAQGPTGAAIANAVAHALGLRVRELPLTPERVIAAIERQ